MILRLNDASGTKIVFPQIVKVKNPQVGFTVRTPNGIEIFDGKEWKPTASKDLNKEILYCVVDYLQRQRRGG